MVAVRARVRPRRGLSLIEMMIAVLLLVLVFGVSVGFFRAQTRAVDAGAGRLDAVQSARYALQQIEGELREAGGVTGQPVIVMADRLALTFNANVGARTADPSAAFVSASLDTLAVEGFRSSRARTLPLQASKTYPAVTYVDANGDTTRAETISYFLRRDTVTSRPDLWVMYRRANDRDSTVVTRNIQLATDTTTVFSYRRVQASGALTLIAGTSLPLFWDASSGWTDSIRVVDVRLTGIYRDRRRNVDVLRPVATSVRVSNGGRLSTATCGSAPAAVTGLSIYSVSYATSGGPAYAVRVQWTPSSDESGGARDVAAYTIFRRTGTTGSWVAIRNVTARRTSATYLFDDASATAGAWSYGVQAVDCGPNASTIAATGYSVTVP